MRRIALIGFLTGALLNSICYAGPDPSGVLELEGYGNSDPVGITAKRGRNDFTIKETLASGDSLLFIRGYGYNSAAFGTSAAASIEFQANQAWTTTANGSKIIFKTTPDGTITPATVMTIDDDGNVAIAGNLTVTGTGATTGAQTFSSVTVTNQQVWGETTAKSTMTPTALSLDDGLTLTVAGPTNISGLVTLTNYVRIYNQTSAEIKVTTPTAVGLQVFDTTIKQTVWSTGTATCFDWVNSTGTRPFGY